ncbi:MAG: hypothetical protein KDJ52_05635 [Anaerolineae bacterium]|nr:hypothetical protein [Anaerolineae bacterium]
MGKLKGTLCEILVENNKKHRKALEAITTDPKFECKRCKEKAIKKKWLCKPKKLK